jgi:hypothetical protein
MHGQRSRLLGFSMLLLPITTLALAACNSNSVSGNQSKPSTASNAEAKAPPAAGPRSQEVIDASIEIG